jgi:hypothetical protein
MRNMCGDCWRWWRQQGDRAAKLAGHRSSAGGADLDGQRSTGMRCGFDRLAERVKTVIGENPQSGHLFVFRSRRGDRLKILVWDRDGFVLWYNQQSSHYTSFD